MGVGGWKRRREGARWGIEKEKKKKTSGFLEGGDKSSNQGYLT